MRLMPLRWRDWPLGFKSAAAVAIPLLLLLLALAFSYRLQQGIAAAEADVRRALAIEAEIQTLHALVVEAATGVRGYLLTGRDEFLLPYRQARAALPRTQEALRQNVRDPEVMARLAQISELLQRKLDSLEKLRAEGLSQAPAELQAHMISSTRVLDALREEIEAMRVREAALVRQYSSDVRRALERNFWVDVVTSLLVLGSGVLAFQLLSTGVVGRVRQLADNADRLARGEPLEPLIAARDELGQLAERLQNASVLLSQRADEARLASQSKTQFLSRTSHELRTPLNAILGFAQLLEVDLTDSRQTAQVRHILVAGRHLLALIDEVLDVARIESGELKLSKAPLNLLELVEEVQNLLLPLADRQEISVRQAPELSGVSVMADRQRLRQVLINLLSNAIKYNRPGGEVHIGLRTAADRVWVTVRDTGVGIRPELLPRLFAPFERLDAEGAGVEGTGLGLAVSRQLMLHMGGDIEVESTPGHGSVFSLRLPLTRRVPDVRPPVLKGDTAVFTAPVREQLMTVLVVEDNSSNLALLRALLNRRPQWRMLTAADGESGLELARTCRPDLILLDLHLPAMGGDAVLSELRADPDFGQTPIVIISADALPATIGRLREAGATDYLTKPLEVPRFLTLLDDIAS